MKLLLAWPMAACLALTPLASIATTTPFINEFHYDNGGTDVGEGVEIAALAGTVLDGWSLLFYNGSTGAIYGMTELAGTVTDQAAGFGTLFFETGALQNGAPDGIALVDDADVVLQFLSYEGSFIATAGAAAGMLSTDIGVAESSDTNAGWSLQLTGSGRDYEAFSWSSGPATYGAINTGQDFAPVPLPASLPLLAGAMGWLLSRPKCRRT